MFRQVMVFFLIKLYDLLLKYTLQLRPRFIYIIHIRNIEAYIILLLNFFLSFFLLFMADLFRIKRTVV